ncbi:hypothetical protein C8R44DRAFT_741023 [Mycena epipterygia]|nr:hypothetical protein C8R44DRAFT_741023 [Mycena epipterygia]
MPLALPLQLRLHIVWHVTGTQERFPGLRCTHSKAEFIPGPSTPPFESHRVPRRRTAILQCVHLPPPAEIITSNEGNKFIRISEVNVLMVEAIHLELRVLLAPSGTTFTCTWWIRAESLDPS